MIEGKFAIWSIYSHPDDLPDTPFVVRLDIIDGRNETDTRERWLRETLEEARHVIWANDPTATFRMVRSPDDVPCLVECWI